MPAGAEWEWLEAYGLMEAHPKAVHGDDWAAARQAVEAPLERLIPRADLNAEFARGAAFVDRAPAELFQRGSGWGALELLRLKAAGFPPFCSEGLAFAEASLSELQAPWAALLKEGALAASHPDAEPYGYMVQPEWRALLEAAVKQGRGANWSAWLHLGVMRYYAGERDAARRAWERSLVATETPWARRNLAVLAREDKRLDDASEQYVAACRLRPSLLPLAVECGQALIEAGRPGDWLDLLEALPEPVRSAGRIRLLEGRAALAVDDFDKVEGLFVGDLVIDDLREGERSLSELWFAFHERRISVRENARIDDALRERVRREFPVPKEIDFRMSSDAPVSSKKP